MSYSQGDHLTSSVAPMALDAAAAMAALPVLPAEPANDQTIDDNWTAKMIYSSTYRGLIEMAAILKKAISM